MNFQDFSALYDFSLIEAAVQSFFCGVDGSLFVTPPGETDPKRKDWTPQAGFLAFYINANITVNQACRPRVKIRLHNVNHVRGAYALDANGNMREKAWQASMEFGIVTEPNYAIHCQLRSQVLAIIAQGVAISQDGTLFAAGGINQYLKLHQVSEFWSRNASTDVVPADGAYMSLLPVELAFSVPPSSWPIGMQTF